MLDIDSITSSARKEAWYGSSHNPYRRTTKSNTWGPQPEPDLESGSAEAAPQSRATLTSPNRTTASESKSGGFVQHWPLSRWRKGGKDEVKKDDKPTKHKHFTFKNQLHATIFNSWINILLLAAPVGIAINYAGVNKIIVFVVNFIAIIPLAAMLSFATEEISLHVGETLGGLLNASFGYVPYIVTFYWQVTKILQKRSRIDSCSHCSRKRQCSYCPDITDRKYFVQPATGHGHVLFLWGIEENRTVL